MAGLTTVTGSAPVAEDPPVFSGARALELIRYQCDLGPRIPASEGNLRLRQDIVAAAGQAGLTAAVLCFEDDDQRGEGRLELCNIIVSAGPPGGDRLWIGAHYDSRPVCDRDPDPERRDQPLVGANDGASGVAVLWHLLELMGANPPSHGVDLIFFDGEDSGVSGDLHSYCRGSAELARTWQDFSSPLATGRPRGLIVLDMVGEVGLQVPMEGYSLAHAREWTEYVFARAQSLDLDAFVAETGRPVFDDHVPFLEAGIPAVDLIDFDFPQWHTAADTPTMCSAASLEQVGRLMVDLVYNP